MQLSNTQFSIHERGLLEILDLSVHVCRVYWLPLLSCLILGAAPFAIANYLLLHQSLDIEFYVEFPFEYLWVSALLIVLEAPAATVFIAAFLGQAVFEESPRFSEVVHRVWKVYGRVFWCDWIQRGIAVGFVLIAVGRLDPELMIWMDALWIPLLLLGALTVRAFRPFINEIIVLEQNPMRSRNNEEMTIARRSHMLHDSMSGVSFIRTAVGAVFGCFLGLSLVGGILCLSGTFLHDWKLGPWTVGLWIPCAIWLTVGFLAVGRFLGYLDVRIRQEGWEVELLVRAEAEAMENRMR